MQEFNIQLNMDLEEFRRLAYVFKKHGMEEAFNETYVLDDKVKATERVEKKLSKLYNVVNEANDGIKHTAYEMETLQGSFVKVEPQKFDVINISVDSYEYKNFK